MPYATLLYFPIKFRYLKLYANPIIMMANANGARYSNTMNSDLNKYISKAQGRRIFISLVSLKIC